MPKDPDESSVPPAPRALAAHSGTHGRTAFHEPGSVEHRIAAILEEVRPWIQQDGGDVEFLSFEDGLVKLKLVGACTTCPSSLLTLKMGIERTLKEQLPEVREVVAVDQTGMPPSGLSDVGPMPT